MSRWIKKYCIIRREDRECGICSFIITNLGGINYCLEKKMIPIIDMQTIKNPYIEEREVGIVNAWELYFKQPTKYGLEKASRRTKIIDGCDVLRPNLSMEFVSDAQLIEYWRGVFHKSIRFQPHIKEVIEHVYKTTFSKVRNEDVIGVLCRGTDYRMLRPKGHPVQPDNEYMISLVKDKMNELKRNKIFLVTEDMNIIEDFKKAFDNALFYCEGTRYRLSESMYLAEHIKCTRKDSFNQGLEYLSSIYCLSKCDVMIAGRTSGSIVAHLMAENEQNAYFVDLGIY